MSRKAGLILYLPVYIHIAIHIVPIHAVCIRVSGTVCRK